MQFRSQFDDADEEDANAQVMIRLPDTYRPPEINLLGISTLQPPQESLQKQQQQRVDPASAAAFSASLAASRAAAHRFSSAQTEKRQKQKLLTADAGMHSRTMEEGGTGTNTNTNTNTSGRRNSFSSSSNKSPATSSTPAKKRKTNTSRRYGYKSLSRPMISDLSANDILCGPGAGTYPNAGNQFFRRLIRLRQEHYRVAKKKPQVQRSMVLFIYDVIRGLTPPGRLKARGSNGEWIELDKTQAQLFISASLSEGVTGLVRWIPPILAGATDSGSEGVTTSGERKKRRKFMEKAKPPPIIDSSVRQSNPSSSRNLPQPNEVIEIDSDSSDDNGNQDDVRFKPRVFQNQSSALGRPNLPILPGALNQRMDAQRMEAQRMEAQRAEALRQYSESAALSSAGATGQYHPGLAHLRGGMHPLLGDSSALAMSRLGRVPSTIPTSLLLGTPPNLGGMNQAGAGLSHHGAPGMMGLTNAASQHLHFGALGASALRGASGFSDPRFATTSSARQLDDYLHQIDGRGE